MPNLSGKAIGKTKCSDCGKPVTIKVSKTSKAYYYCPHVSSQTGNYCGCRKWWGVDQSQDMQTAYLDARKAPKPAPAPAPEQDDHDDRDIADIYDEEADENEDGDGTFEDERDDDASGWGLYG